MKEFKDTIDDVIGGKYPINDIVKINEKTPDIIQALGFNDLPIAITQKHLIDIMKLPDGSQNHYHGLSKSQMINLEKSIASPTMVLTSYRNPDRILVVTDELDFQNRPIIAILQNNGFADFGGRRIKSNIINSVYGKDNFFNYLLTALKHNEIMYYDKEKSHNLLRQIGKSYPEELASCDSNIIIRQLSGKVNTLLQNNFVNDDEKNNELRLASEKLIELGSSEAVAKTDAVLLIPVAKDNIAKLETKEPITQKENTISKQLTSLPAANKNNNKK